MWIWDDSKGQLSLNGSVVSKGYSGRGRGKNNPALASVVGVGPIPPGLWHITSIYDSPNTGPRTIVLEPGNLTDTMGRWAFRIHGDSIKHPGDASRGCIILPRSIRNQIWTSGDRLLKVV